MMGVYLPASELFGMLKAAEGRELLKSEYLILEDTLRSVRRRYECYIHIDIFFQALFQSVWYMIPNQLLVCNAMQGLGKKPKAGEK
jgi:hypothetical protein